MPAWPSLVVVQSPEASLLGTVTHLEQTPAQIGRGPDCVVHLPLPHVSRLQATLVRREEHWWLEDSCSASGTYLNQLLCREPTPLVDGDTIGIGPLSLRIFLGPRAAQRAQFEAERYGHQDPLTALLSRKALFERLAQGVTHALQQGTPLSVLLFNIDRLRLLNDQHGFSAGDGAITSVARWLREALTPRERLGRIRGDVFLQMALGTELPKAVARAEVLRELIAARTLQVPGGIARLTVSVGVAALQPGDTGHEALVERADEALYEAQRGGRNCTRSKPDSV